MWHHLHRTEEFVYPMNITTCTGIMTPSHPSHIEPSTPTSKPPIRTTPTKCSPSKASNHSFQQQHQQQQLQQQEQRHRQQKLHPYNKELSEFQPCWWQVEYRGVENYRTVNETLLTFVDTLQLFDRMMTKLKKCWEIAIDLEHHSYRSFQVRLPS